MAGLITLYKNAALTQELSDGSWLQSMILPTVTLPGSGTTSTTGVVAYGLNTGTTTMLDVYIQPTAGAGIHGSDFVSNLQIAPDVQGNPGSYGASGSNVLVYSGSLAPSASEPNSNSTSPGVSNPSTPPTLAAIGTTSNLAGGVYTVSYSYTNAGGETLVSASSAITLTAGQSIRVSPISLAADATGINYYMSAMPNRTEIYKASAGTGGTVVLAQADGFFRFWARQVVDYNDPTGYYKAQLTVSSVDIG
jgi:hypothetical protein